MKDFPLTEEQIKHLESVKWIIGDTRANGKTTVLAKAFIDKAMKNPGRWIKVFDHDSGFESTRYIQKAISDMFAYMKCYGCLQLRKHDMSIRYNLHL